MGARDWLVQECRLPAEEVVGFRAPYLVHNPVMRQVLNCVRNWGCGDLWCVWGGGGQGGWRLDTSGGGMPGHCHTVSSP